MSNAEDTDLRAAIIGCGKIGSEFADDPRIKGIYNHAGAWRACKGIDLVAVCDADPERARRCAERWNVAQWHTDAEAMLEQVSPDLLSVCTPDGTHFSIISAALASPNMRGILAEKPLALEPTQAEQLVTRAAEQGIRLAVNYSRRYSPGHQALRQRIENGELGAIQSVAGFYTKGTLHNGTHWFDLARFLVGEVTEVRGFDRLREAGEDPTLDVRLMFQNGASGSLLGLDATVYSLFEMDIVGTLGRVRIVDGGHWFENFHAGDSPYYSGYRTLLPSEREAGRVDDTLFNAALDLVASVRDGRAPLCDGHDALRALAIGLAARTSAARRGETQALDP